MRSHDGFLIGGLGVSLMVHLGQHSEIASLSATVKRLSADNSRLGTEKLNLFFQLARRTRERDATRVEVSEFRGLADRLSGEKDALAAEVGILGSTNGNLEAEKQQLIVANAELCSKLANATEQTRSKDEELRAAEGRAEAERKVFASRRAELEKQLEMMRESAKAPTVLVGADAVPDVTPGSSDSAEEA